MQKLHSPTGVAKTEVVQRGNGKKKFGDTTYTNKTIIKRLRSHMLDNMLSKHSMTKPTIQAIRLRIQNGDEELKHALIEIENEHNALFEKLLIDGLKGKKDVDSKLFRIATQNKKAFLSPEQLAISEGIATVVPVAPQLHFHQIGTRKDFEQLEHRNKDDDAV